MNDLNYGPINKSLHTQKFELLVKCILQRPNAIHYDLHKDSNGKDALFTQIGQTQVNVSSLLRKINFNHLSFSQTDNLQYFKQFNYSKIASFHLNASPEKYSALTMAEKYAIFRYTDLDYTPINSFLYGNVKNALEPSHQNSLGLPPHALITNIGFLTSGLNKIMPDTGYNAPTFTFRGEKYVTFEEIKHRIQCIENDLEIDTGMAFMSTSECEWVSHVFSGGCVIKFEAPNGKDISGLSLYNEESEYLFCPNHIIWDHCRYQNGTFYFKARIVAPLIEDENKVTPQELTEFNELINFAKDNNINLDFITDFNRENHLKKDTAISIEDVINFNTAAQFEPLILQKTNQPVTDTYHHDILDDTPVQHWMMTTPPLNDESFHFVNEPFQI